MLCFSVSIRASLPRTFHLTFGASILLHGRISKIWPRHEGKNDTGYNYESGQWVPIGGVRPASGPPKGGSHHPPGPRDCLNSLNNNTFRVEAGRVMLYLVPSWPRLLFDAQRTANLSARIARDADAAASACGRSPEDVQFMTDSHRRARATSPPPRRAGR